ncbi:FAD-dependent oxidoreductase [Humisphaera borealis]|uniref:FAD-dependent oxidoreductase n=1 Tax=Humisphaera borealis TaxID=2807512 RepID=A0A7M2WYG0_9BACT|nr:FAD-dependent oxidoreductase [Humisphaera borealis]QOV90547.1 FAD-dependent oxidoreductase [Humisphaera borealis]
MTSIRSLVSALAVAAFIAVWSVTSPSAMSADAAATQSPNLKFYYPLPPVTDPKPIDVDVCVYGGTSGGVTAAIQASRMGKKAVVVEFGIHVGGLTTGGLSATDGGSAAGGLAREFYGRVGSLAGFRPAKAEQVMLDMLKEANVPVLFEHRLVSVTKDGKDITSIKCENGVVINAKMFIDATYEGDLFAAAGCSFHVGREANHVYNETINGVQPGKKTHQFVKDVDPYVVPGDPKSGLLWGISPTGPGEKGAGDNLIQAYNFRMQFEKGGLPFVKPNGYDAKRYELLLRYIQAGGGPGVYPHPGDNNNNGAFSTDHIGLNYEWPDGDGNFRANRNEEAYFKKLYETREKIYQDHINYQMGLVWFLCNDERVPREIRDKIGEWGMARHSFEATGGWPHQLYIREGRRLLGELVMTEHHCRGAQVVDDSVGLAQYTMDSHNTQRYVVIDPKTNKAVVRNEGDVQVGIPGPYPVAYRAIVPKADEIANLLVPVCLSSSHIAYGSIRMEPVFMVLGQSAATAACMAIDDKSSVQQVPYEKLKERLLADKQMLVWTGPKRTTPAVGSVAVDKLPGLVMDDAAATFVGDWGTGHGPGFVGDGYRHDSDVDKGTKTATFAIPVKTAGKYEVRISYAANNNRATNAPVKISGFAGGESKMIKVDQKKLPPIDKLFLSLGSYEFAAGSTATIVISTEGTNGHVIADAVQLLPQ